MALNFQYLRGLLVIVGEPLLHVERGYGAHSLQGRAQQTRRIAAAVKTLEKR